MNDATGTTTTDYVSIRLRGGAQLPRPSSSIDTGGVSIATNRPMYILGDYNTVVWRPASLMADALTFLSNPPDAAMSASSCTILPGWCDTMQIVAAPPRTPVPTTVNAAILAGHSETTCDWQRAGCASPVYGGGLENFPRFLENWWGITFTYSGSLVSLFTTQFSHGLWGNSINPGEVYQGGYYSPPARNWSFDVNFRFPDRLPPGTPTVGTVVQTAYRPIY